MSDRILNALYPAGARGLTPTELLQALNAEPRHLNALEEKLQELCRWNENLRVTSHKRYVHPAYPAMTPHPDGSMTVHAPSDTFMAALAERLDREYETINITGYGPYSLHVRTSNRKPNANPHPRDSTHAKQILEQLFYSNQTLNELLDNIPNAEQEHLLPGLQLLQRTNFVKASITSGSEVLYHLTWIDARLTRSNTIVQAAEESDPAQAATMLLHYLSEPDELPDEVINLTTFTIPELADAISMNPNRQTEYTPLAAILASTFTRQGHLRLLNNPPGQEPRFEVHPHLITHLTTPGQTLKRLPDGYGTPIRETTLKALQAYETPTLENLEGFTVVDALLAHLEDDKNLTSIAGALSPYADENDALTALENATTTEAATVKTKPSQTQVKGSVKAKRIKRELKKLLNSNQLPTQTELAKRFKVTQSTISVYLRELRAQQPHPGSTVAVTASQAN